MAKEIITRLIDDIDGSEAAETVEFGIDGKTYEIDLSKRNASQLRKALKPYIDAARPVRGRRASARRSAPARSGRRSSESISDVREWARSQGYEVADRGRIPKEIQDAYDAAH